MTTKIAKARGGWRGAEALKGIKDKARARRLDRHKAMPPDPVRDEILKLMAKKKVDPVDLLAEDFCSRNTLYEFLNGRRSIRTAITGAILEYLREIT